MRKKHFNPEGQPAERESGITPLSRDLVEMAPFEPDLGEHIAQALEELHDSKLRYKNRGDKKDRTPPVRMILPEGMKPLEQVTRLGKAARALHGARDTVMINADVAFDANPITDAAIQRLESLRRTGILGFAVLLETPGSEQDAKRAREDRLRDCLHAMDVPLVTIELPVSAAQNRAKEQPAPAKMGDVVQEALDAGTIPPPATADQN